MAIIFRILKSILDVFGEVLRFLYPFALFKNSILMKNSEAQKEKLYEKRMISNLSIFLLMPALLHNFFHNEKECSLQACKTR